MGCYIYLIQWRSKEDSGKWGIPKRKAGLDDSFFTESDNESDITIPESLVENARNAEPRPSERNKYLPENYDADQFHFKGPLIIEHRPQFTSVRFDLCNGPYSTSWQLL